jgi:hypothetical protein
MKADVPDFSTKGFNPNNNRLSTAIAKIVSQIAMMAFDNKWNDAIATNIEKPPFDMVSSSFSWWSAGKHSVS